MSGARERVAGEVRLAIAGVGSCASSLVQTVITAKQNDDGAPLPGVMHDRIGRYGIADVELVAAFDVDDRKVGLDVANAIEPPLAGAAVYVDVPALGVTVDPGPLLDGIGGRLCGVVVPSPATRAVSVDDVQRRLEEAGADVLACLLPTGATEAVQAYAAASARAGVAFVNATPEPVANDAALATLFADHGTPLLGDDLRSHLGATTLHTALIELLHSRALEITEMYQLNVGGNMDFLNLSDPVRSRSKVVSKRRALTAAGFDASDVAAGPNGYVAHLGDRKTCFIHIEALSVLDTKVTLDLKLEVEDSPNAAGVLVNAVRAARVAIDDGVKGVVDDVCPMLFKSPPRGTTESEALRLFEDWVEGHRDAPAPPPSA